MTDQVRDNIQVALDKMGIKKGDHIVCHASLIALGKTKESITNIIDSILDRIGEEGTFCAPAFSYSGMRGELFDPTRTKSKVGALSSLLQQNPKAIRSLDPNFSYVCLGGRAKELTDMSSKESFGSGSFFEKLEKLNGKALLLGVGFEALPYFMFLEKKLNVPYRYDKTFSSKVKDGDEVKEIEVTHYVRDLEIGVKSNRNKIAPLIENESECTRTILQDGEAKCVSLETIKNVVLKKFNEDQYCLVDIDKR